MANNVTKACLPGSKRRYAFLDRVKQENPRYLGKVPIGTMTIIGLAAFVLIAIRASDKRGLAVVAAADDTSSIAAEARLTKEEAERREKLPALFEGSLVDSKNGEDFRETFGMRHILFLLGHHSPEEVAKKSEPFTDYSGSVRHPDAFRGKWVRVQGLVASMSAVRLDSVFWGETDVYRGFLTQTDGSDAIAFDMLAAPPPYELRRDLVQMEGLFYRTVRYETRESKWVEIPYLLVKNFKVVQPTASKSTVGPGGRKAWLVLGALAAGAAWVAFHRFRHGRRPPRATLGFPAPNARPSIVPGAAAGAAASDSAAGHLACTHS